MAALATTLNASSVSTFAGERAHIARRALTGFDDAHRRIATDVSCQRGRAVGVVL